MCFGPDAPEPVKPLAAQAPPPIPVLAKPEDDSGNSSRALTAGRGRSSLRIDKTQNAPGAAGSGLNIPT